MNSNSHFLSLLRKASSKDEYVFHSPSDNPENMFLEEELSGVWRTNLMIEGEQERHDRNVLLCRTTSIEDNMELLPLSDPEEDY